MSKKKHKFDLSSLVHRGDLRDQQKLYYVADPSKNCEIVKQPHGEYKLRQGTTLWTVHAFVQHCLGEEAPDHAAKWLRTEHGKSLFELWHKNEEAEAA